jgi:hypothetical protein
MDPYGKAVGISRRWTTEKYQHTEPSKRRIMENYRKLETEYLKRLGSWNRFEIRLEKPEQRAKVKKAVNRRIRRLLKVVDF